MDKVFRVDSIERLTKLLKSERRHGSIYSFQAIFEA